MSFERDLLAEFDRDLARGAQLVADDYVRRLRRDPDTPEDTGRLADGIKADAPKGSAGRVLVTIRSTARSDAGADYGTILDRSTGRVVEAAAYGHRAFGPIRPPVGGMSFLPRFRVTTKHVGWWERANRDRHLVEASQQLSTVNL